MIERLRALVGHILNHWIIASIGVIGSIVGIWQFIVDPILEERSKRRIFDSLVSSVLEENQSEFTSSTNIILSVLPSNVLNTRDNQHWRAFSRNWSKHTARLDTIYKPLSDALAEERVIPGKSGDKVCDHIKKILTTNIQMEHNIDQIVGLSLSYTETESPQLSVFGPVIRIPRTPNMKKIHDATCEEELLPPVADADNRSEKSKLIEELNVIQEEIAMLNRLRNIDYTQQVQIHYREFITTYAGFLSSKGMLQSDAESEARLELEGFIEAGGSGYSYEIRGMNDIVDQIHQAHANIDRDFQAEINAWLKRAADIERRLEEIADSSHD